MYAGTSSGICRSCSAALVFRMAMRVSYAGRSMRATSPQLKRLTRRSSRSGISDGAASELRTICRPPW